MARAVRRGRPGDLPARRPGVGRRAHPGRRAAGHVALRARRPALPGPAGAPDGRPRRRPSVVAEKWDGEGRGLHALEFGPLPDDRRLLVGHERRGREELLIWDVDADTETEIVLDLPGDVIGGLLPGRLRAAGRARPRRPERALPLRPGRRGAGEAGHPDRRRPRGERPARRHGRAGLVELRASAGGPPGRRAGRAVGDRRGAARGLPGRGPLGARPRRGHPRPRCSAPGARPYATAFLVHGGPEAADDKKTSTPRSALLCHTTRPQQIYPTTWPRPPREAGHPRGRHPRRHHPPRRHRRAHLVLLHPAAGDRRADDRSCSRRPTTAARRLPRRGPLSPARAATPRAACPPRGPRPVRDGVPGHGGPEAADDDSYRARRAAYVDAGYAVVHVNYRGSTGYGSVWRDALTGRPGLTELEDVGAVYDALVAEGVVDPQRALLSGGSWGGFLTLLGLGTQPERWAAGIAEVPVADYLAAYEDEMEGLRAYDRALFGGSPEEKHDVYVRSSPITYVDAVAAPGARGRRRQRPALPDPADRQLPGRAGEARQGARGLPVRRRPRVAGHRGDDPPGRGRPLVRARHVPRTSDAGRSLPSDTQSLKSGL